MTRASRLSVRKSLRNQLCQNELILMPPRIEVDVRYRVNYKVTTEKQ